MDKIVFGEQGGRMAPHLCVLETIPQEYQPINRGDLEGVDVRNGWMSFSS